MYLKTLVLLGLVISSRMLNAQTDFRSGYIIKSVEDTIFGQIDYRGDLLMSGLCKFKDVDNTITEYSPTDIDAYRFINGKYFVTKEIDSKKVFMEYLIQGKINIYYLRDNTGDHYYLDKEDVKLVEIPYEEGIKYIDDRPFYYESKKHIGILNYFMQDAPKLKSEIKTIKKPGHRNLIKLAENYHNAVCENEVCIIYEKKDSFIKISITPIWGFTKYKSYDKFANEFGGYIYFWAPRANEKLFFKTGLTYNQFSERGTALSTLRIPIQFQYIYRAHKLQPHMSGGVNILSFKIDNLREASHTLSLNAGLNYQISNRISISTSFNSDYTPLSTVIVNEYETFDIISYSLITGLRIDL